MGLNVDEIKKYTQMIADMQRDIEDQEQLAGSFHHNLHQYADDGIFNAAARKAAAQNKLREIKNRYADVKPADMHWADFIKQLAQQAREKKRQKKRRQLQRNKSGK
jgi:N-acetylneuraminic acid mutarotase